MITIYNPLTYERKNTIVKYNSAVIKKSLYSEGSIQLEMQYLPLDIGDIVLYDRYAFIIRKLTSTFTSTSIIGKDLKSLLSQRIFESEHVYEQKTAEYIVKDVAAKMLATGDRAVNNLTVEAVAATDEEKFDVTFEKSKKVSDTLNSFCAEHHISYDFKFSRDGIVFYTFAEKFNPLVKFSARLHNLDEIEYEKSNLDLNNVFYYPHKESEDTEETIISDGTAAGIERFEGYTSETDLEKYKSEHKATESLTGTPTSKLIYDTDYTLGDIVDVEFRGLTDSLPITQVAMYFEHAKSYILPTFGTPAESKLKKILKG